MKWLTARNIIIVTIGIVVIAGFFVHPRGQITPYGFLQGNIWLSDTTVQQPNGLYDRNLVTLPYRWVLSLAVAVIVGALIFGRRKSN